MFAGLGGVEPTEGLSFTTLEETRYGTWLARDLLSFALERAGQTCQRDLFGKWLTGSHHWSEVLALTSRLGTTTLGRVAFQAVGWNLAVIVRAGKAQREVSEDVNDLVAMSSLIVAKSALDEVAGEPFAEQCMDDENHKAECIAVRDEREKYFLVSLAMLGRAVAAYEAHASEQRRQT